MSFTNFTDYFVDRNHSIGRAITNGVKFDFGGVKNEYSTFPEFKKNLLATVLFNKFVHSGTVLLKLVTLDDDGGLPRTQYYPVRNLTHDFARFLLDGEATAELEDYGDSDSWTQLMVHFPNLEYLQFVAMSSIGLPGRPKSRSRSVSRSRSQKRSKNKDQSRSRSKTKEPLIPLPLVNLPANIPGSRAAPPSPTSLRDALRGILPTVLLDAEKKTQQKSKDMRSAAEKEADSYLQLGGGNKKRKKKATTDSTRPKRARQNDLAFFPYLLNEEASRWIDLDFAQIFRETEPQYEVKHCLISTLEYFQIDAGVLSDISQKYQNFALHIPRSCLKETAEHCRIRIALTIYRNDNDSGTIKTFFTPASDAFDRTIEVGLYEDHLFPNIVTKYTSFFLRNLTKLSEMVDDKRLRPEDIYKAAKIDSSKNKVKFSPVQKPMTTIAAVRCLSNGGFFDKVNPACLIRPKDEEALTEENVSTNQRMWEFDRNLKRTKKEESEEEEEEDCEDPEEVDEEVLNKGDYIFFAADFESHVQGQHKACMAGCMQLDLERELVTDPTKVKLFEGPNMVADLFSFVVNTVRRRESERGRAFTKKVVFFHNLKYDITLFEADPNIQINSVCEKGGSLYAVNLRFSGMFISVRDSLKMITVGISKFPSAFQLPAELKKQDEFIIYEFFTEDNSEEDFRCTLADYVSDHCFDGDQEKNAVKKQKFISGLETFLQSKHWLDAEEKFSPWKLYQFYLRYDVLVLAGGLHRFNENFKIITEDKLQVLHSLTISSFANRYMGFHGCFNDANEMSLSTRSFQAKAVYGGRVYCTPEFEGKENRGDFDYFDACSLYPTAIKFVCEVKGGFPTGPCQLLREEELNYDFLLRETTEYTVEIRITAIHKKQLSIPFIAHRQKTKSIDYLNDLPADGSEVVVTVDRQTLEDYIEFHQIQFEILRGVYWSGSKNPRWGAVIENLYQERLKCKVAGHGVRADNLKLIMNSAYGKTIMRTTPTEKVFIPLYRMCKGKKHENPWRLTIFNQLHLTKSFRFVGESQIELVRFRKDISYTLSKYGSMILAASKHIMNRVFNLMSDMKLSIYYTDTDSFVIDRSSRSLIADAFRVRYGQELIGDQLGQMHSDFSFKHEGKSVSPELVHSTHFFPMAKKLYLHCLVATMPDGQVHHSIQFKSKGCTQSGLLYKSREYGEGDEGVVGLYRTLSLGHTVEVPLNPPGNVRFVYDKDNRVTTDRNKIFYRNIKSEAAQRLHPISTDPVPVYMPEGEFEVEDLIDSD